MASTAVSSPTVPDTMMNGKSSAFDWRTAKAAGAVNRGIE